MILDLFPFVMSFGEDMVVRDCGRSLSKILPGLAGRKGPYVKDVRKIFRILDPFPPLVQILV